MRCAMFDPAWGGNAPEMAEMCVDLTTGRCSVTTERRFAENDMEREGRDCACAGTENMRPL